MHDGAVGKFGVLRISVRYQEIWGPREQRSGLQDPEVLREVDPSVLNWPSSEEASSDFGGFLNRQYRDFRGASWTDAGGALAEEDLMVSEGSFEAVVRQNEDEDIPESGAFYGLDAGVASTVLALCAARCIPTTSCNGMPGHHESYPVVAFFCRPARLPDLLAVANEVQCGLTNADFEGSVIVYAQEVTTMMEFARNLIARRHSLSKIRSGRSKSRQVETSRVAQLPLPFS